MDKDLRQRILLYKSTMAGVKYMLKNGIINAKEYAEIEHKYAQVYGLSLSVIYRSKPLI